MSYAIVPRTLRTFGPLTRPKVFLLHQPGTLASSSGVEHRYSGLAVPAGLGLGEIREVGDITLNPACGSGTTAVMAARLDGRFIVIDRELAPVATTLYRLLAPQDSGDHRKTRKSDGTPPAINVAALAACDGPLTITDTWKNATSLVVHGDAPQLFQAMPDSSVALVYADDFSYRRPYGTTMEPSHALIYRIQQRPGRKSYSRPGHRTGSLEDPIPAEYSTDTPDTPTPCCPQGVGTSACWDRAYETGQEDLRTEIYRVLDKGFEGHAIPVCEAQDAMASTPSQMPEIPSGMQKEFVKMIQDPEQHRPLRNLIEALDDCNTFMREHLIRLMQDPEHRGVLRDLIAAVDARDRD